MFDIFYYLCIFIIFDIFCFFCLFTLFGIFPCPNQLFFRLFLIGRSNAGQRIKLLICQIRLFFLLIPNIRYTSVCLCHSEFRNGFYIIIVIIVIKFQIFCSGVICSEQEKFQNKANQASGCCSDKNTRKCNLHVQCQTSCNHDNRIGNRACNNRNLPCVVRAAVTDHVHKKDRQGTRNDNQQHLLVAEQTVKKFLYH